MSSDGKKPEAPKKPKPNAVRVFNIEQVVRSGSDQLIKAVDKARVGIQSVLVKSTDVIDSVLVCLIKLIFFAHRLCVLSVD